MRSLIVCAALIVACGTPPVASSAAPFTSSEPSPTASASAAPSAEKPRDVVVTPAGDLRGEHAIVAQYADDQPGANSVMHIWDVPFDGTAPRELVTYHRGERRLLDWDRFDLGRQLSPDGRRLVVADALDAAGRGLLVIDLVSGASAVISTDGGADQPAWSPDGARIAYRGYTIGSPFMIETGVWLVGATGGSPQQIWKSDLQPGTGAAVIYGWTGDGSAVAIARDSSSLSLIDVPSRSIAKIFAGQFQGVAFRAKKPTLALSVSDPQPPPSGGVRGAPGSIGTTGRVEVRDMPSAASRVAFHHENVGTLLFEPRWNPGTDEILLHWVCGAGATQRDELVIVDAVSSSARTIPVSTCVNSAAWSADGAKILYTSLEAVRVRDADGSNDRALFRPALPSGASQAYIFGVAAFAPR